MSSKAPIKPTPQEIEASKRVRPPPPPPPKACPICNRRHMTDADRERGIKAGNVTSYNVAKAFEAYHHFMHELAIKQTPPEYLI